MAIGVAGIEARKAEQPGHLRVEAAERGGEAQVLAHRAVEQGWKLWHQANLSAQLEHVSLTHVAVSIGDFSCHRIGEPVEEPQQR